MKKIMILMADRTGTGHKSSANAIEKRLKMMGYEVKQVNCFKLMGKAGQRLENCYIPLTTKHPYIWKVGYTISQMFTNTLHSIMYKHLKKTLLNELQDYKPDLIISVHGMFTKAVSKLLRVNNLKIPFMINAIDLVNSPKVWRDKNADIMFLPTEKIKEQYIKLGFDEKKLVVSGFPIREDIIRPTVPKQITDKVNILMVNTSVNLKKNIKFAKEITKLDNANIKFVCGRDEKLYTRLLKEQEENKLPSTIKILGFVTNMNELLSECHILLTKAGPNMILEGTRNGSAVIVTGHIPGQEAKNYQYITENEYGLKCENPKKIYALVKNAIESGKINEFLTNAAHSKYNDGAIIIATVIDNYLKSDEIKA